MFFARFVWASLTPEAEVPVVDRLLPPEPAPEAAAAAAAFRAGVWVIVRGAEVRLNLEIHLKGKRGHVINSFSAQCSPRARRFPSFFA
jgi:hypothetical protein